MWWPECGKSDGLGYVKNIITLAKLTPLGIWCYPHYIVDGHYLMRGVSNAGALLYMFALWLSWGAPAAFLNKSIPPKELNLADEREYSSSHCQ